MKLVKRIVKFLIGILLIPVVISVSLSIYSQVKFFAKDNSRSPFILGLFAYLAAHLFLYKKDAGESIFLRTWNRLYIAGHEFVHALAAILSGGRVKGISIQSSKGTTTVTKSNFFILLSPYFLPIYTILTVLAYFLISLFKENFNFADSFSFIFLVGLTWGFHIILSLEYIKMGQKDLTDAGYIFSIALVYIVNLTVLALILSLIFSKTWPKAFFLDSYRISKDMYLIVFKQLFL